jgi:negative regulator of sigma E activity
MVSLCEVAEDQVRAARELKHDRLRALSETYSDLLFELSVLLQEPLPRDPEFKARAKELATRLSETHSRLHRIAGSMLHLVGRVLPNTPPQTYTRSGRIN